MKLSTLSYVAGVILFMLPVSSVAQRSATRKPIMHEMLWMMKRFGTPIPSRDGKFSFK
jgi:hypothetical protein